MGNYGEETYEATPLAQWFHSFPHINMTFSLVNSTFNTTSVVYLESLGILAAIPGLWLILNLIAFLIYFLSRCCQKEWKQKRNLTPIKWTLAILGLLCCGGIGIGFYGNNDADVAVHQFADATNNIQGILKSVKAESQNLEETLNKGLLNKMKELRKVFNDSISNATAQGSLQQAVDNMEKKVVDGLASVEIINDKIKKIEFYDFPTDVKKVEDFRWPVTLAVLSLFLVLCIVLFLGIMRHSRSVLITFSVLAFFVIIINWLLVSVYLAASVALGDFCIDPEPFIRSQVSTKVEKAILDYYLDCRTGSTSPFAGAIKGGENAIDTVEDIMKFVQPTAREYYNKTEPRLDPLLNEIMAGLNETEALLGNIEALLDCQSMHRQFITAVNATCGPFLYGLAFLLLSAAVTGTFFIILEWLTSNTWIYIRKKVYVPVDEQDPFLPPSASSNSYRGRETYGSTAHRPRHIHTPPQTPPFPSSQPFFCSNGRMPRIEDGPIQGRYTPPPLAMRRHPSAPFNGNDPPLNTFRRQTQLKRPSQSFYNVGYQNLGELTE